MRYKNIFGIAVAALMAMAGCNDAADERTPKRETLQACEMPLRFMAEHPGMSRVTATAFESGDRAGVFMTDAGVALEASGNRLNNELLTCEGADWTTARTLYWDEGEFDVFAYYPYDGELRVVDDVPFSVARNQHAMVDDAGMDGYEASDFLWANSRGVAASEEPVRLSFRHRMSRLVVRLVPGDDYEGDIPEDARVYVHNTVPEATIDLSVGLVTKDAYASAETIEAKKEETGKYAAIVVPQRLDNQVPLIEIVVEGVSYMVERKFVFKQVIQHTVNVTLAKNPDQVKIEIGGEIEDWD